MQRRSIAKVLLFRRCGAEAVSSPAGGTRESYRIVQRTVKTSKNAAYGNYTAERGEADLLWLTANIDCEGTTIAGANVVRLYVFDDGGCECGEFALLRNQHHRRRMPFCFFDEVV